MQKLLPFDEGGAPCEAGAEGDEEDVVAAFDFVFADEFVEGHWDGGAGGVAVFGDVYIDFVGGYFEAFCDAFDDAGIGLVGDEHGNLLGIDLAEVEDFEGFFLHDFDGVLENFLAVHLEEMELIFYCFGRSWH